MADDNVLIRQGVASIVSPMDDIELVGEYADVDSLFAGVAEHQPDVVITDIRMPPTHTDEGIRAAKEIRRTSTTTGVVVLSQFADPSYVLSLFEDGSDRLGYLLKDRVTRADLERAIRSVARGDSSVDAKIVEVLVASRGRRASAIDTLTPREREVLALIAEGLNNAAIGEELTLGHRAISKHINSIFSKLGLGDEEHAHRRVKAVLMWLTASD